MVRCTYRPIMTIALDFEVEHQAKPKFLCHLVCQTLLLYLFSDPVSTYWSLMRIERYVVVASLQCYFKVLLSINLFLNNIQNYKRLFLVCGVEILPVTVNNMEVLSYFNVCFFSGDFRLQVPKISKTGTLVSC